MGGGGGGGGGTMLYVYANFEHETLTCVTNTPHIISWIKCLADKIFHL